MCFLKYKLRLKHTSYLTLKVTQICPVCLPSKESLCLLIFVNCNSITNQVSATHCIRVTKRK